MSGSKTTGGGSRGRPGSEPVPVATGRPRRGPLPPLNALRAFEAVVRLASIRRAAAELGVDHSGVARQVRTLEAWIGRRLMETGPRGVTATAEGARLAAAAVEALDLVAAASEVLRPARGAPTLRIWCVPGLATGWLAARLDDLEAALGRIEIVLRATPDRPRFDGDADVEIRWGEAAEAPEGTRSELVDRGRIFPVASPAWLAEHGPLADLAGLAAARLIHEESRDQWRRFFAAAGHDGIGDLAGPRLWYASSAVEAAAAGQGVALATRLQAADGLSAGRLVEPVVTDVHLGDYWLIAPRSHWDGGGVGRFRRWLAAEVAATVVPVAPGVDRTRSVDRAGFPALRKD